MSSQLPTRRSTFGDNICACPDFLQVDMLSLIHYGVAALLKLRSKALYKCDYCYYYYYFYPGTRFPGNKKYAMQCKKVQNGVNLTPPPPPSQNSHAVLLLAIRPLTTGLP